MKNRQRLLHALACGLLVFTGSLAIAPQTAAAEDVGPLTIEWQDNFLTVRGERLAGDAVRIHYMEAFCRPGSTDREWGETTIEHRTRLVEASEDRRRIELVSELADGVTVRHRITAGDGEVDFQLVANNPTDTPSQAHWAQPCIRVDRFTARGQGDYVSKCFVFLDGQPTRLPTEPWATEARYIPGQVYRPRHVPPDDVNPRPVSRLTPSNGLIGCYSANERQILATAWEPYQELFQGVGVCLHSDPRLGGLAPGETKTIRGKLYLVDADMPALVERYRRDFPEHVPTEPQP
jgi:hypothetical protein